MLLHDHQGMALYPSLSPPAVNQGMEKLRLCQEEQYADRKTDGHLTLLSL